MSVFTNGYVTPWWLRVMDAKIEARRASGTLPPAPPPTPFPEEEEDRCRK